ncbi:MAG: biosynthetic-type acetolactate synthase large subunit [Bacteroidales bacterium]|nr:biosynthetic-type acetolactate synthase large subunit [Bacteroidales bacterium]
MENKIKGSEAFWKALIAEGVDTVFGYPGGQIMHVYDSLCSYTDRVRHILVRHEQGAIHAAQGFARVSGRPGVVLVTSGPGATNVVTGLVDAMTDSTPLVVVTGQVPNAALGTDAFQEADVTGMTGPITKWNYQIRRPEDVAWAIARAFYIAGSGRPGPVVLDFTKDAQVGLTDFHYEKCTGIRSYHPDPFPSDKALDEAAALIDASKKPFVVFGQGVTISHAEDRLAEFLRKGDLPSGSTMLGLGALPTDFPNYEGMIGMHGHVAANVKTSECDLLIAIGMRFSDRVTGSVGKYARNAKVIHIDIDKAEIGKIIPVTVGLCGDAGRVLEALTARISPGSHREWLESFVPVREIEKKKVIEPELHPKGKELKMGEVVDAVTAYCGGRAIVVTDVGQNQLMASRYSRLASRRSFISSGGLGTMGFGLPAAIGAAIADPSRPVCLFVGDGGIQMTIQEFGTIMQEHTGVKVILLNNNWLGNVRQWQQLFYDRRYSATRMINPNYEDIAKAYGIKYIRVKDREALPKALETLFSDNGPCLMDVLVEEEANVMPMVPPGSGLDRMMLTENSWYENE